MDPKEKAFSTLLAVSALLSANSNLRTFNLENGKINSNEVPLTQVDENLTNKFLEDDPVTPTIYSFPEYYYLDKNENTCIQPFELKESIEKEGDLESIDSKYDFSEFKDFEIDRIEKMDSGYVIKTTEDTIVYLIPINNSYSTRYDENIKQFPIEKGNNFELAEIRTISDSKNGREVKVGIIANTYGGKYVSAILLSDSENGK